MTIDDLIQELVAGVVGQDAYADDDEIGPTAAEARNDLFNRIDGTIKAWQEEQD